MRVLITGGDGFIGSHLVEHELERGHEVRAVDLTSNWLTHLAGHPGLEIVEDDLRDGSLVRDVVVDVDIVYHLASAHLDVTLADNIYRQVNVDATLCLVRAAHGAGVKRFVHCSTNSVLGVIRDLPADETTACAPTNIYEQTKLEGERVILRYFQETGFPVVVVRPAWVYGSRCPRTERLMRMVSKGRFVMFGRGETLRHPVYIGDMIRAFELAAEIEDATGETFFIAGNEIVTIEQLVEAIAEVQGEKVRIVHLPMELGRVGGKVVTMAYRPLGKRPPFSERSLDFFHKDNGYDISKARKILGFEPMVDLTEGLTRTWEAIQSREANR